MASKQIRKARVAQAAKAWIRVQSLERQLDKAHVTLSQQVAVLTADELEVYVAETQTADTSK